MKTKIVITLLVASLLSLSNICFGQQSAMPHKPMTAEDSAAINSLAMYPDSIRRNILEACMYPAAIVNIATLQKNSSAQFSSIINGYNKDEQENLYNLARYPNLISALVQGGKKSTEQINAIIVDFPNEIHATALSYGKSNYETLKKIDELQQQTNAQFEQTISDLPVNTQSSFRSLIQMPEVISLLNDHLELTVRVGDHYKRNPQRVLHKLDSANLAETSQHAEDSADWQQQLKDNPEAQADLKKAGNEYAQANGYSQDDFNTAPNPGEVENYTCAPYSYWFGYPTWYPYSYWYPYPYWYDCGYYFNSYGAMVVIGLPSFYFTNWFFYYPEHWHNYPYLHNHFVNHYYGPRGFHSGNSYIVHNWVAENRNYLPHDFIENRGNRVESIRQVGQFHLDAQNKYGNRSITSTQRDEYFDKNASKYGILNDPKRPARNIEDKQGNTDYYKEEPVRQPAVKTGKQSQQNPVQARPTQAKNLPTYNFNNINKATEYHKSGWDNVQPSRSQPSSQPSRSQPSSQPSRSAPSGGGGRGGGGGRK
jgi:hypothetical protein